MSLSKIFSNIVKNGTNALNATASYVEGQIDKKRNEEFQDNLSAKRREEFGGKMMTDNEYDRQKKELEKWKKIADEVDGSNKKQPKYSKGEETEQNVKKNKYNNAKYIKRKAQHDKKKEKKNNLRNLQKDKFLKAEEFARSKFDEYVEKLNLSDLIEKAKKAGLEVGWSTCNDGAWVYYGFVKTRSLGGAVPTSVQHGIGVLVDPRYLNVIDDQLMMFKNGAMIDTDQLDTSNLYGFVLQGTNQPQCNEVTYDTSHIKCIDEGSSQAKIFKTVNNTLIEANDDEKIGAYVIGIKMHGNVLGGLSDKQDLILTTIEAFDAQRKEFIKINKPCLIINTACFNARTGWSSPSGVDDYDKLCKTVSNCTNQYTVCAYHNENGTTHWGLSRNMFLSNYDYAFDLYKDGKLIKKNISAEEMNKYMNNILNNGTWDIPDSREKYIRFMEQLVPAIKNQTIDTEPSTSTIIGPSTSTFIEPSTSAVIETSTEQLKEPEPSTTAVIEQSTDQPKEPEPSTEQQQINDNIGTYNIGTYVGLGAMCTALATIVSVACCYDKKKCCFKPKLDSQNQNKTNIKNDTKGGTVEIYQNKENKESDREYITNKDLNVTQKQIPYKVKGRNTKRATTPNRGRNIRRQNGNIQNLTHSYSDVKTFGLNG